MKRYGLIGYPLGHSFSARYFADKFAREGIADCRYDLYELKTIEELPALLEAQPGDSMSRFPINNRSYPIWTIFRRKPG